MNKYVIDASIILRSLLNESSDIAEKFKKILTDVAHNHAKVFSHHLISAEVANGLRFTLKDKETAVDTFKKFARIPLTILSPTKAQQEKTLSLSYDLNTTIYDTSYHVLAKSHGAIFLTCDHDYFKKAKSLKGIELWE
ncbi:type II toxin-antitoxin system VapC family toxin [Candidatus Collierbacteria bacterium]|nr:type II toxin-antitoxin system VapC family toxin [Candidatus Collierbacteria bacterium]